MSPNAVACDIVDGIYQARYMDELHAIVNAVPVCGVEFPGRLSFAGTTVLLEAVAKSPGPNSQEKKHG